MWGGKTSEQWVQQYASSHQHPVNRLCHSFGIPIIVISVAMFVISIWYRPLLDWSILLFLAGWVLQFVGHGFEKKPPEFFRDWRFLFVGVRWWVAKMRGKA